MVVIPALVKFNPRCIRYYDAPTNQKSKIWHFDDEFTTNLAEIESKFIKDFVSDILHPYLSG